jgi:tRNA(Ile)-lysidine synthase TilS/MesJ/rhodanese-related sulfurtransferase
MEVAVSELEKLNSADYVLIDMRGDGAYQNGYLPGAIPHVRDGLEDDLPRDEKIILYCTKGQISADAVIELREHGFDAYHLAGGYVAWLMARFDEQDAVASDNDNNTNAATGENDSDTGDPSADTHVTDAQSAGAVGILQEKVELSLRKKFKKTIFSPFTRGIRTYELIQPNDKIAVCISGGKDSMLMAKLFQELTRHRRLPFELVFLVMDPGYAPENRKLIEQNAKTMGIPITVFETDIFDSVAGVPKNACYLCARMRRGHLYSKAKELGCNKIALGHHYDDVIETILMGMLWGAQIQTMMPKLKSDNFEGMELIRPMYFVREHDVKKFRDYHDLHFLQCACRFTDTCSVDGSMGSKRTEIKHLIAEMKKTNPCVESHIFSSVENVHLGAIVAYKKDGERHHFLDDY